MQTRAIWDGFRDRIMIYKLGWTLSLFNDQKKRAPNKVHVLVDLPLSFTSLLQGHIETRRQGKTRSLEERRDEHVYDMSLFLRGSRTNGRNVPKAAALSASIFHWP